ncbi:unnamed protein product [Protopolystoma xenopodis]|uniref:Uncharacterized protein n=1 Tax=Protopolystoma xenopodis TaxID=117903 RepID=A0A3S5BEA8_9PLAT|nr:unnamed protein product [Protopolystoma xenopodis]
MVLRIATLTDDADYDAGETFGNVPSPRFNFGNEHADNGPRTRTSFRSKKSNNLIEVCSGLSEDSVRVELTSSAALLASSLHLSRKSSASLAACLTALVKTRMGVSSSPQLTVPPKSQSQRESTSDCDNYGDVTALFRYTITGVSGLKYKFDISDKPGSQISFS